MRPLLKLLSVGLLTAGLGLSIANAQGPRGGQPRGGPAAVEAPRDRGGDRRDDRKADTSLDAWVKTLAEKISDPHDAIRDSSRSALVAVGQPALPLLRKLADGDDAAKAFAAKKLIGAIERPQQPGGPGGGRMPMGGRFGGGAGGSRPTFDRGPNSPWPNADRRPDANNPPRGDRRPDANTPPRGDRRPDDANPPRGERRPEANNPPRGDRQPEPNNPSRGDRRPDNDRRPEANQRPGNPVEETIKSLNLNEKQRKQVADILQANHKKVSELSEKARDGKADRTDLRTVRDGLLKDLKGVLTAEQYDKTAEAIRNAMPPGDARTPRDGGDRPRGNREPR